MQNKALVRLTAVMAIAVAQNVSAQVALSGNNYTQTFDGLGGGLPAGWSVRTNATATSLGVAAVLTTNSTGWGNTGGQFANYASTLNNGTNLLGSESTTAQTGFTNRCPGVRLTGSFGDPGAAFALQLQNTLGLANFQVTLDMNMLSVQSRSNLWLIDYGIGSNPAAFVTIWTNTDSGVFGATTRTVSFGNALDNQAQNVWIRVVTLEAAAGTGSRDTFGIDNFKLDYGNTSAPSPIPLNLQIFGTNAVLSWSNAAFALQSAPSVNGTYTNIPGATSPYTNPVAGAQKYFRLKAN